MIYLFFLAALAGVIGVLAWQFPYVLSDNDNVAQLAYLVLLIGLIGSGLLVRQRVPWGRKAKEAAVWVVLFLVLLLAYQSRDRLMAGLLPHRPSIQEDGSLRLEAAQDGHFHLEALVNGQPVRFMVDTGASSIILTTQDARRVGFDPANLHYTQQFRTANGITRGAPVILERVEVGPLHFGQVRASVNRASMSQSLLGMSFLRRLFSVQMQGDRMTLTPSGTP